MAPGFCTCKRDFPERRSFHPPIGATWHFLCDKPVLPPAEDTREPWSPFGEALQVGIAQAREKYRGAAVARVIARGSDPEAIEMAEGDFGPGMPFSVGRAGGVEGPCAKPGAQAAAENGTAGQEVGLTARPTPAPPRITPTGTGWPDDGEAQRIAEVFADARAELDRGL